ncbi:MAG: 6-bladed beta-propeller [Tannerella sp.]|jgi:hypothetical protein|nr:6-bladed beta-propeller [Tannerella sp.]
MKIFTLFLFLGIFCSCNRTKQKINNEEPQHGSVVIDSTVYHSIKDNRIKIDINSPQKASLFDYFSHIELIPLETNNEVLIGYCEEIICYKGRYYVFDRDQQKIQVFDDNGSFIFKIDKRGQGPGDYSEIRSIYLNTFTENIDIVGMGFIYSYNLSGNHVRTLRPSNLKSIFDNIIAVNDKTYVLYTGYKGEKIHYFDLEDNKIFRQEYEEDPFFNENVHISAQSPFYEYNGKGFFYRIADNKTYEVGADSLITAYILDFGRYNYDPQKLGLPNDPTSIITLPYRMDIQGQNNKYLFAQILLHDNIPLIMIYDKSTDEERLIKNFIEQVDFVPRKVSNEYVLSWCSHGALERYVTKDILDNDNFQKLNKLLNSKEEENTIIIKYYFK